MNPVDPALAERAINTIRTLSIDAVQHANSGHPGMPMGAAPMAYALWGHHLKHDPKAPDWADRDRFVLSAGHGSMLLYSLLHLCGYDLSMEDIKAFRQWESRTPGHPEFGETPGVEATTGPLGQGSANVVGMAIAERALAHRFNRPGHEIVNHHTWGIVSDGDLMEGISAEAASLAGHLKLGKLCCLYDANGISLDGPCSLAFDDREIRPRYEGYGWQVLEVQDGDRDLGALDRALREARETTDRPTLIIVRTTIGFGSPAKAGSSGAHGAPLGEDEVRATKENLGWDPDARFFVPDDVKAHFAEVAAEGAAAHTEWSERFAAYRDAHPELAAEFDAALKGELPAGWDEVLPSWSAGEKLATRAAGGKCLNAVAERIASFMGGDADLSSSTKTAISDGGSFEGQGGSGRNLHFGVREHAMGAICNGMAYHGGVRSYASTFFVFSDYMRAPMRLAALCGLPVTYVFTHDSIAVGEDGPTHQPVEHLTALRAIPNLHVVRPADANETADAWRHAMNRTDGPTALVLSRQGLPVLERPADAPANRGGYVLSEASGDLEAVIIATGSEVSIAVEAQAALEKDGVKVRVVSMPCVEAFDDQDEAYREQVIPQAIKARVAVEAGVTFGWHRFVGDQGLVVGIDRFGASAPGGTNLEKFGFTPDRIVEAVRTALDRARS